MSEQTKRQFGSWVDGYITWEKLLEDIVEKLPIEFATVDYLEIKLTRKPPTITRKGEPTYNDPFGTPEDVHNPAFSAWKVTANV